MKPKINRQKIYEKYGGHCAYCGCDLENIKNMQVDHLLSKAFGPTQIINNWQIPEFLEGITSVDDERNLMPSCRSCNNYKHAFTLESFRKDIGRQIEIHNKKNTYRLAKRFGLITETNKPIVFYFEKNLI